MPKQDTETGMVEMDGQVQERAQHPARRCQLERRGGHIPACPLSVSAGAGELSLIHI